MSDVELAWAAGFYDGEGCTSTTKVRNGYCYVNLQVIQADPRPLHRFHKAVGGLGKVYGPYHRQDREHHRVHWRLQASNKVALAILDLLLPYLSEPKREQYVRAVARQKEATRMRISNSENPADSVLL